MKKPRPALYARHRFPAEVISLAVWLYFRFLSSLRMVEEMVAARGIEASHETVRRWAETFGREFANRIRRRLPRPGDRWHLDEVVITLRGRSIGSGGPWIRTALSWISCSRAVEAAKPPSACCASC
jgi:putative transposase